MIPSIPNVYPAGKILPYTKYGKIELDGESIRIGRFFIFSKKGTRCVSCGLIATFFRKERSNGTTILNLYGIRNNEFILFTRDHIIPASRGGTKELANLQPMCAECNTKKGDKISFKNRILISAKVIKNFLYGTWYRCRIVFYKLKAIWKFDLTDRKQFIKAAHYTNLQPLTIEDHKKKSIQDTKEFREKNKS